MIRRPPRSTLSSSSAASDVYKRQRLIAARKAQINASLRPPRGVDVSPPQRATTATAPTHSSTYEAGASARRTQDVVTLSLIHISEPTRLLSISYAVFCLRTHKTPEHLVCRLLLEKKKKTRTTRKTSYT